MRTLTTALSRMKAVVPLAILLAPVACLLEETDDFSMDCTNPFSMGGAWEDHEGASDDGVWWRFDLEEQPIQPGAVRLTGSYVTDFFYHLEGFQGADTVGGSVQGGMQCLTLGGESSRANWVCASRSSIRMARILSIATSLPVSGGKASRNTSPQAYCVRVSTGTSCFVA